MFDNQQRGFTLPAPRHLRLAVALAALALAPGMVSALDLNLGIAGVSIGRDGIGVNALGRNGVNANVSTSNGVGVDASVGGSRGVNADVGVGRQGVSADASVGGSGGVNANVGVGGQGVGVNASVGGSNGVSASVGVGSSGVNVGIGNGPGTGNDGPGNSDPGNTDPGTSNPGGNDPGSSNPGSGIVITDVGMLLQTRLAVPATCPTAGNYDLLIGVPVLTSANQMIGVIAGAYVEGGMLMRLRVAVDPAYAPPGGCVEFANLAGSRAGAEGLMLNVSMPAVQGALHRTGT